MHALHLDGLLKLYDHADYAKKNGAHQLRHRWLKFGCRGVLELVVERRRRYATIICQNPNEDILNLNNLQSNKARL